MFYRPHPTFRQRVIGGQQQPPLEQGQQPSGHDNGCVDDEAPGLEQLHPLEAVSADTEGGMSVTPISYCCRNMTLVPCLIESSVGADAPAESFNSLAAVIPESGISQTPSSPSRKARSVVLAINAPGIIKLEVSSSAIGATSANPLTVGTESNSD